MSLVLGIDIGGSGSRVALRRAGTGSPRRELRGDPVSVGDGGSSAPERAFALLAQARRAWPEETADVDAVGVGITGLATLVADPSAFAAELARANGGVPVAIAIDAVTAHLGALDGRAGSVVALGTGAVALGTDHREVWHRVDGWGHLFGDRGGGAWIGRRALARALEAFDGVDPSGGALLEAFRERMGHPLEWPRQVLTRDDRASVLAALVPVVAGIADRDPAAASLLVDAGRAAARSAVAALGEDLDERIAWTGGVFQAHELLRAAFADTVRTLRPDAALGPAQGDPLDGALLLGERAATCATRPPFVWAAPRARHPLA